MQLRVKSNVGGMASGPVTVRCPACKQIGTFQPMSQDLQFGDAQIGIVQVGHRVCPNPPCSAHLFVVLQNNNLKVSYPPERIDFDSTNVPAEVIESLEEAITCHANQCFVAAAIMVRKTLDLLCSAQNVPAGNLKDRIIALGSQVVLPPDLLSGLDDLRLLGNDAAHIESQAYIKVSQEEVDVAIEFTKEVLKAIYQYSALLGRLRALKKQP